MEFGVRVEVGRGVNNRSGWGEGEGRRGRGRDGGVMKELCVRVRSGGGMGIVKDDEIA